MLWRTLSTLLALALLVSMAGCGDESSSDGGSQELEDYVGAVEPIRLGINELLDRADPIMSAYREGDLGAEQAQRRMDALEHRVADYAVEIAEVEPVPGPLRAAHDGYAHVFVLQDTYLSALVEAIPDREFNELPDVQDEQRELIIAWRTALQVRADADGVELPADLEVAGRGEIVPSPRGD